jgi:hypothetical protein
MDCSCAPSPTHGALDLTESVTWTTDRGYKRTVSSPQGGVAMELRFDLAARDTKDLDLAVRAAAAEEMVDHLDDALAAGQATSPPGAPKSRRWATPAPVATSTIPRSGWRLDSASATATRVRLPIPPRRTNAWSPRPTGITKAQFNARARGGDRTRTALRPERFKPSASASSATRAGGTCRVRRRAGSSGRGRPGSSVEVVDEARQPAVAPEEVTGAVAEPQQGPAGHVRPVGGVDAQVVLARG